MPRLLAAALALVLVVFAFIDCLQSPAREVRSMRKPVWLAVIVLVPVLGAVAWLVAGRPRPTTAARPRRPVAPDDDVDFLRGLRTIDEEHEELLRRRERDRRGRGPKPGTPQGPAAPGPAPAPPAKGDDEASGPARGEDTGRDTPVDEGREPGS